MMGARTSCGGGIDTRKRLPSRVTAHGTGGVANSRTGVPAWKPAPVGVISTAIGRPESADRKITSRPSSRQTGVLPPSREICCLVCTRESEEPGGVNDAM